MSVKITPYKDSNLGKKEQVAQMFNNISDNYDGLNRMISFGIDVKWRKKVVKLVANCKPKLVLDIATGTGDLAINISKNTSAKKIIGLDISEGMLNVGKQKVAKEKLTNVELVLGDSEKMPFDDNTFDAITVAFGIRNFETLEKGLKEILRVLKPSGTFVYNFHSSKILPLMGKLFSNEGSAYSYLSESAAKFPHGETLNNILRKVGFIEVENNPQTFGVATIYTATK